MSETDWKLRAREFRRQWWKENAILLTGQSIEIELMAAFAEAAVREERERVYESGGEMNNNACQCVCHKVGMLGFMCCKCSEDIMRSLVTPGNQLPRSVHEELSAEILDCMNRGNQPSKEVTASNDRCEQSSSRIGTATPPTEVEERTVFDCGHAEPPFNGVVAKRTVHSNLRCKNCEIANLAQATGGRSSMPRVKTESQHTDEETCFETDLEAWARSVLNAKSIGT